MKKLKKIKKSSKTTKSTNVKEMNGVLFSINSNVKKVYRQMFPNDEFGAEIRNGLTFEELWIQMKKGVNFYDIINVGDSLLRERIFKCLALAKQCDYDEIYNLWSDGGKTKHCEPYTVSDTPTKQEVKVLSLKGGRNLDKQKDYIEHVHETLEHIMGVDKEGLREIVQQHIDRMEELFEEDYEFICNPMTQFAHYSILHFNGFRNVGFTLNELSDFFISIMKEEDTDSPEIGFYHRMEDLNVQMGLSDSLSDYAKLILSAGLDVLFMCNKLWLFRMPEGVHFVSSTLK